MGPISRLEKRHLKCGLGCLGGLDTLGGGPGGGDEYPPGGGGGYPPGGGFPPGGGGGYPPLFQPLY